MSDKPEETTATVTETATATPPVGSTKWQQIVGAFAKAINKPYEEVTKCLVGAVGESTDDGLDTLADTECCPNEMIKDAVGAGVPPAKLNKAIKDMRATLTPAKPTTPEPAAKAAPANMSMIVLPQAPTDESLFDALRVGGVRKVEGTEINAALRVLLGSKMGIDELPARISALMEEHAESLDEPAPDAFYELQRRVNQRRYAEVLDAIGAKGIHISEPRKQKLLGRMQGIWGLLYGFQSKATAWQKTWQDRMANPGALMAGISVMFGGGGAGVPGMMDHPDIAPMRDAASGVIDGVNKIFRGTGIPVARALADDTLRIKEILKDDRLPAAIGAANREDMLKKLGAAVSADYSRMEKDLSSYVLSILEFGAGNVSPEKEPAFLIALQNVGMTIPWQGLMDSAAKPATGKKRDNSGDDGQPFRRYDQD
ncbi:hypothetical protein HZC53_02930 [Candidatus Uhrbacteria bacterium]|nr:hypothetical protein [Candidatus Uhrbacteria bacterium]